MDRRVTRGFAMRDMSNVRTWTPFKPKPEDQTEDEVDSEIATQRLADLASGKDKLISGPDLDARMKAWEATRWQCRSGDRTHEDMQEARRGDPHGLVSTHELERRLMRAALEGSND